MGFSERSKYIGKDIAGKVKLWEKELERGVREIKKKEREREYERDTKKEREIKRD